MSIFPDFFKLSPAWTTFMFSEEIVSILEQNVVDIFTPFYHTSFENLNVVLLTNQLTINLPLYQRLTPQLKKIYNELDFEGYYPTKDGCLEHWTKQGVFIYDIYSNTELGTKVLDILWTKDFLIWIVLDDIPELVQKNPNHIIYVKNFDTLKESGIFKKINQELLKKNKNPISY
jgi:hypothetical protein